jgi:hypothetical protein
MSEPKTCSGNQRHNYQAVFNVTARLQSVIPEIERLRNMAAETNQQKQKRTELKKLSSHFTVLGGRKFRERKMAHHLTILGVFRRREPEGVLSAGHPGPSPSAALMKPALRHEDDCKQQEACLRSKSPGTHCPISEFRGNNLVELRIKANSEVT